MPIWDSLHGRRAVGAAVLPALLLSTCVAMAAGTSAPSAPPSANSQVASTASSASTASADPPAQPQNVSLLQEVVVTSTKAQQLKGLRQRSIFMSPYGDKALDRQQLKSAGVVGGAAQALSFAPGISVAGYGQTGGTKATISVNGIKQGWGGFSGGTIDTGSLSVSFDGIPMANPATGLWETPEVPQTGILEGARVSYGPGDPLNRWYNSIGGAINFVPIQPGAKAGGSVALTYGSFSTQNADLILQTGRIDGWETVFAGGAGKSNDFRTSPNGFSWPTRNFAGFLKTRKEFSNGNISFGAYMGDGHGWRPTPIPLGPNPLITVNGQNANGTPRPGPLFSQATTGYYSAVNASIWSKNDYNRTWLLYARQNFRLSHRVTFHNQTWYRKGDRLHNHYNNFVADAGNLYEHNNPYSHTFGDKAWSEIIFPYNDINVGGYYLYTIYNSHQSFFNPNAPYFGSVAVPNAKYRSDYWYVTDAAAFVQDAISPVSWITVTPGLREVSFNTQYYPGAAFDFPQAFALYPQNNQGVLGPSRTNYDKLEPSVSARLQPLDWLAFYGNWATAYKLPQVGGGGGLYQSEPVGGNILEKSVEYQAGVKVFWDQVGIFSKVLFNLNYFHMHFSNQFIGVNNANGIFLGLGQGDSLYHGVNFSAEANIQNLKMFANLGLEKSYFNHYAFQGLNYNGLPVSNVPDSTFNIGAYYHFNLIDGVVIKPRAWYQFVGKQYLFSNFTGAPSNEAMPSYGLLNMALAFVLPSSWYGNTVKSLKVRLEVDNVLDKQYNLFEELTSGALYNTAPTYANYPLALPGAPRAFYATIAADF